MNCYVPLKGDVIESPNGRKRIRILLGIDAFGEVHTITYWRKWWFRGTWGNLFGFRLSWFNWSIANWWSISNLVDDHGWKMVHRNEDQKW